MLGLSVAALSVLDARGRGAPFVLIALLGVAGGLAHAAAAPIVVATRDQSFAFLFRGAALMALRFIGTALFASSRARGTSKVTTSSTAPTSG